MYKWTPEIQTCVVHESTMYYSLNSGNKILMTLLGKTDNKFTPEYY